MQSCLKVRTKKLISWLYTFFLFVPPQKMTCNKIFNPAVAPVDSKKIYFLRSY